MAMAWLWTGMVAVSLVFGILILVLLFKPSGIMGHKVREKV